MSHVILAVAGSTERFTAVMALLAAVLGALSAVVKIALRIGRSITKQIEALEHNTTAVQALSARVDRLEGVRT